MEYTYEEMLVVLNIAVDLVNQQYGSESEQVATMIAVYNLIDGMQNA